MTVTHCWSIFLLVSSVLSSAPFSFTLHNDRAEGFHKRTIHTWLSFAGPDGTTYFNFIPVTSMSALGLRPDLGRKLRPEKLLKLNSTEQVTLEITQEQYRRIRQEIDKFYSCSKFYSRYPRGAYNTYNDVTACHHILSAGNVTILNGIEDPLTVAEKINTLKGSH